MTESLPLGWTQIRRRRKRNDPPGRADIVDDCLDDDCTDLNCRRRSRPRITSTTTTSPIHRLISSSRQPFIGRCIMCLPDGNPDWFPGYVWFSSKKAWGLVGEQLEVDECLQCADGGYREIKVTLEAFGLTASPESNKLRIPFVQWTGGDLMRLETTKEQQDNETTATNVNLQMIPSKLLTLGTVGKPNQEACRLARSLFDKLLRQRYSLETNDEVISTDRSLLELYPDLVLVIGEMTLSY